MKKKDNFVNSLEVTSRSSLWREGGGSLVCYIASNDVTVVGDEVEEFARKLQRTILWYSFSICLEEWLNQKYLTYGGLRFEIQTQNFPSTK